MRRSRAQVPGGEPFSGPPRFRRSSRRSNRTDRAAAGASRARARWQYTAQNLSEKGIHEVTARRFCLVAAGAFVAQSPSTPEHPTNTPRTRADHPLVSAISENAEKLQMGDISMMCVSPLPSCAPVPCPCTAWPIVAGVPCPSIPPAWLLSRSPTFLCACDVHRFTDVLHPIWECQHVNPTHGRPEGLVKISSSLYDTILPMVIRRPCTLGSAISSHPPVCLAGQDPGREVCRRAPPPAPARPRTRAANRPPPALAARSRCVTSPTPP